MRWRLKLNNVFEVAQQAAEQYLLNVQERCKKIENDTKKACQVEKDKIIKNTEKICNTGMISVAIKAATEATIIRV